MDPKHDDEAYIKSMQFKASEDFMEPPQFDIVVTTKRLDRLAPVNGAIQADATHDTNNDKCPCLMVGHLDMSNKFHPIGISLSTGETEENYKYF